MYDSVWTFGDSRTHTYKYPFSLIAYKEHCFILCCSNGFWVKKKFKKKNQKEIDCIFLFYFCVIYVLLYFLFQHNSYDPHMPSSFFPLPFLASILRKIQHKEFNIFIITFEWTSFDLEPYKTTVYAKGLPFFRSSFLFIIKHTHNACRKWRWKK